MDDRRLFNDPQFQPLLPSLIAVLWYDAGQEALPDVDAQLIGAVYAEAIEESSRGILKSDRTRQKLLKSLQDSKIGSVLDIFRREGNPIPASFIQEQFSRVISEKNAGIIAGRFSESVARHIGDDLELCHALLAIYRDSLEKAQWVLDRPARTELREYLKQVGAEGTVPDEHVVAEEGPEPESPTEPETDAGPSVPVEESGGLQADFTGSRQFPSSDFPDFVIPLRGLRKLEAALGEANTILLCGPSGAGKSQLVAAYLTAPNAQHGERPVFYFSWADRLTLHSDFIGGLLQFCGLESEDLSVTGRELAVIEQLQHRQTVMVLDDLQYCRDPRSRAFIQRLAGRLAASSGGESKLILVDQGQSAWASLPSAAIVDVAGLSLAEGVALLRDKAGVSIPRMFYRPVSAACSGHPEFLHSFKLWCREESHADTEFQRFIRHLPVLSDPSSIRERMEYVLGYLFDVLEREAPWVNSLLRCISVFRCGVPDRFLEHTYQSVKGVNFQKRLEALALDYRLIRYDEQLDRYFLPPTIREFYYGRFENPVEQRMLHKAASHCYAADFHRTRQGRDALECLWHGQKAGRDDFLGEMCSQLLNYHFDDDFPAEELLEILLDFPAGKLDDASDQAVVDLFLAALYLRTGDPDRAESALNACDVDALPEAYYGYFHFYQGMSALQKGDADAAVEPLENALVCQMETDDPAAQALTCFSLGQTLFHRGELKKALDMLDNALPLYHRQRDWAGSAQAYILRASIWEAQEVWENARQALEFAAQEAERCGEKKMLIDIRYQMGDQQLRQGNHAAALEHFQAVSQFCQDYGDPACQARALESCAEIHLNGDEWQHALAYLEEAQRLYQSAGDRRGLISVYLTLGKVYTRREEWDLSMGFYQKSQEILEEVDDPHHKALLFRNMAEIYRARKEWERALDMYDQALDIYDAMGAVSETISVFESIGDVYLAREQDAYAVEVFDRALALCDETEDWKKAAQHCLKRAELPFTSDDAPSREEWLNRARDYFGKSGDSKELAELQLKLGRLHQEHEEWQRAEECYGSALAEFFARGDEQRCAEVRYLLGTLFHDSGEWEQALSHYLEALPIFKNRRDHDRVAQTLGNISSIEFEQGAIRPALHKLVEILLYFRAREKSELADKTLANMVACNQEIGEAAFQEQLKHVLQELANSGVKWGDEVVIPSEQAEELINNIFYQV